MMKSSKLDLKGREREAREEVFHNRVMDEVSGLLKSGRKNLTLRTIAKKLECSPGTLINRYGSFDLLLLAFNAQTLDRLTEQLKIDDRQPSEKDVHSSDHYSLLNKQLLALAENYFNFALENSAEWQLLFELRLPEEMDLPDWQGKRIERLLKQIEDVFLSQGSQNAESNKGNISYGVVDSHAKARAFWAGIHGITALKLDEKLFLQPNITARDLLTTMVQQFGKSNTE